MPRLALLASLPVCLPLSHEYVASGKCKPVVVTDGTCCVPTNTDLPDWAAKELERCYNEVAVAGVNWRSRQIGEEVQRRHTTIYCRQHRERYSPVD
mgnify:CR=1 FL=1